MSKNRITILIPCYNKEKFYFSLFETLKNQIDKRFNIIFLDDKSTDNTMEILKQFKKENSNSFNIKIISLEENKKIAAARNILIKNVETEYFYFLDADDKLNKKTIKYFNKILDNKKSDLIFGKNTIYVDDNFLKSFFWYLFEKIKDLNYIFLKTLFYKNKDAGRLWIRKRIHTLWNVLIKKEWFDKKKINFLEGYNFEDISTTFLMHLETNDVTFLNKTTYYYNINESGTSRHYNIDRLSGVIYNFKFLYSELEKRNLRNAFSNSKLEKHFWYSFINYIFSYDAISDEKIKEINIEEFNNLCIILENFFQEIHIEEILNKHKLMKNKKFKKTWYRYKKIISFIQQDN